MGAGHLISSSVRRPDLPHVTSSATQDLARFAAVLAAAPLVAGEAACRVGRPAGDAFHLRGFA